MESGGGGGEERKEELEVLGWERELEELAGLRVGVVGAGRGDNCADRGDGSEEGLMGVGFENFERCGDKDGRRKKTTTSLDASHLGRTQFSLELDK